MSTKTISVLVLLGFFVAGCSSPMYSGRGDSGHRGTTSASPDDARKAPPAGQTSHGVIKD